MKITICKKTILYFVIMVFKDCEKKEIYVESSSGKTEISISYKFYCPRAEKFLIYALAKAKLCSDLKTIMEHVGQMALKAILHSYRARFSF